MIEPLHGGHGFTAQQCRLLGLLLHKDRVSIEQVTVIFDLFDFSEHVVAMRMHRLRHMLAAIGVILRNEYGVGWYLSGPGKITLRTMMTDVLPAPDADLGFRELLKLLLATS